MSETTLVTGADGCIGAWVVRALLERGDEPVVFDRSLAGARLALLVPPERLEGLRRVEGDVCDLAALRRALEESGARKLIHLAALQVPFCREDPPRGALVNVVGTVNVLQAASDLGLERVVYASSGAVYGPCEDGRAVPEADAREPRTHYGVYKRANEESARVFHAERGLSSVGLRPLTVYGVGRDQGLTSDLTRAMKAAALGREFTIRFGGATDVLYAADAAQAFLDCADRAPEGAHVFNLHGDSIEVRRFVELVEAELPADRRGLVSIDGPPLPIAAWLDGGAYARALGTPALTPLADGVRDTLRRFEALAREGRLTTHDLPS